MEVWIGCLACYNAGRLVGGWHAAITAGDVTPEDVHKGPTSHEELWVMDLNDVPRGVEIREMGPAEAQRIAEVEARVEEAGVDADAFGAYVEAFSVPFDEEGIALFEDAYCGEYDDREDFAMSLADDLGVVPDDQPWPLSYIDWTRAARDLFIDGYVEESAPGGRIYVFRSY